MHIHHIWGGERQLSNWGDDRAEVAVVVAVVPTVAAANNVVDIGSLSMKFQEQLDQQR